ncbi:WD-40 repeat-containing protein [Calothrix sp. NIES-2100]|uniref:WD40 domain-containing protein n=1 Tax=Calothrix sp. NIES-2100 TaxID=1954172 RepID=UPI000B604100|nr:WD-40 repeat-containing protein [Calothrix sp. NIES-2100]
MRLGGGLPVILLGATIAIVQPLVATALTPAEVYSIAQKITVRIDGANTGSGIIIERTGNTYTVVTNWHVIQQTGSYTVRTEDGRQYTFNHSQVQRLPGVDLAVFQFTSNQNYSVAEKGDSDQVTGGKTVYVAGYPDGIPGIPERTFQALSGQISGRVQKPKDGYALLYTVNAFPGMSGGPILDEQGKLVGIHGRSGTRPDTSAIAVLGIPLKNYLSLVSSAQPVATAPTPQPTNPPVSTPPPVNPNNSSSKFILAKFLNGHKVYSVAISPDGRTLASSDFKIKIWNAATGKEILTLNSHSRVFDSGGVSNLLVRSVAFSPDGKTLASGADDKTIKIWNVETGQEIRTLNGHSQRVNSVAISPDGKTLVSGSADATIKIWNVATGNEIRTLNRHSRWVWSVTISPDGKTLVSCSGDKTIKIWNVETGQEIRTLNGHSEEVYSVAFSPDGKTLVSGSGDKTIKIWNVETGQEIRTLNGHSEGVNSVTFSPDGKTLVSGSSDKTIKIWNVATGNEIRTLKRHSRSVWSVAISPDGKILASGNDDKTIIWRLSP